MRHGPGLPAFALVLLAASVAAGDQDALRAIGQGRALFLAHCVACHGPAGRGDATAPDLARIEVRDGVFDPVHVAHHVDGRRLDGGARRRMPRWGERFSRSWPYGDAWAAAQVWKLTRYLDFIQEPSPTRSAASPTGR